MLDVHDIGQMGAIVATAMPLSQAQVDRLGREIREGCLMVCDRIVVDGPDGVRGATLEFIDKTVLAGFKIGHPIRPSDVGPAAIADASAKSHELFVVFLPDADRGTREFAEAWKYWCRPYIRAAQKGERVLLCVDRDGQ